MKKCLLILLGALVSCNIFAGTGPRYYRGSVNPQQEKEFVIPNIAGKARLFCRFETLTQSGDYVVQLSSRNFRFIDNVHPDKGLLSTIFLPRVNLKNSQIADFSQEYLDLKTTANWVIQIGGLEGQIDKPLTFGCTYYNMNLLRK